MEYKRKAGDLSAPKASGHRILVVGIGAAGSNILRRIVQDGGDPSLLLLLDTDIGTLSASSAAHRVQLGRNLTRGLTTGADPDLGREAALEAEAELRERFRGVDLLFLVAGMGGGAASGASPVVARLAREEGCFVLAFLTLPFHFEGRRRLEQARESLAMIRPHVGALLTFENDRLGELVVPSEGVQKVFAMADTTICHSIRAIVTMHDNPGMIQVGKERLLSVLKGQEARCLFGFGKATGPNRAEEAARAALENPLVKDGDLLGSASTVLVHLSGDSRVTMAEVEQVMGLISSHLDPGAAVFFGVSSSEDAAGELSVAVIGSAAAAPSLLTAPVTVSAQALLPSASPAPVVPVPPPGPAPVPQRFPAPVGSPAPVPGPAPVPLVSLPTPVPTAAPASSPAPVIAPLVAPAAEVAPLVPPGPSRAKVNPPLPLHPVPGAASASAKPASVVRPRLISQEHLAGPETPPPPAPAAVAGVKVDYARGNTANGQPVAPTITLDQPKPSFARPPAEPAPDNGAPKVAGMPLQAQALAYRHRGRFEIVEPTVIDGQDLDIPTYVRKLGSAS